MPGDSYYNSFGPSGQYHVRNYPSKQSGISATVQTLRNGNYPDVVAALASGKPYDYPNLKAVGDQVRKWGTVGFAAQLYAHAGAKPGQGSQAFGSSIPQQGTDSSFWAWGGAEGSKIADAIKGPLDFLKAALWLLDPRNWLRAVEFVAGMVLMLLGVLMLARVLSGPGDIISQIRPGKDDSEERAFGRGDRQGYLSEVQREGRRAGRRRRLDETSSQGRPQPTSPVGDDIPF